MSDYEGKVAITIDGTKAVTGGKDVENTLNNIDTAADKSTKSTKMLAVAMKAVAAVGIVATLKNVATSIFDTVKETETYTATLKTATGGLAAASEALDELNEFAKTTPYTLSQSVEGFVKLKNLGLDPSEKAMRSYGNTASAMGKSMSQMIEAVADASTNEFERLKEFGIKSKQHGDNVTFTFRGVETTIEKSSKNIQEYLMNIGETNFATAMADKMDTIDGQLSNLDGAFRDLWQVMGDGLGVSSKVKSAIESISGVVVSLTESLDDLFNAIAINNYSDLIEEQDRLSASLDMYQKLLDDGVEINDNYTKAIWIQSKSFIDNAVKLRELGIELGYVEVKTEELTEANEPLATSTLKVNKAIKSTSDILKSYGDSLTNMQSNYDILPDKVSLLTEKMIDGKISIELYDEQLQKLTGTIVESENKYKSYINSIIEIQDEYDSLPEKIFALDSAMMDGAISVDLHAQEMEKLTGTVKSTKKELDNLDNDDFGKTILGGIENMSNGFVNMAMTGSQSFSEMATSILSDLTRVIAKQMIMNALTSSLGGTSFGGFLGLAAADGAVFDSGGVVPMSDGGLITQPTLFPMANGGAVLGGESGVEAIMPLETKPNGKLGVDASGISGNNVVINVNDYNSNDVSVRESTDSQGQLSIDVLIEKQVNKAMQNGSLDKSMAKNYNVRRRGY